ncbi:AcrR family transcriptional regulator [Lachnospiraceae bacterium PF1-22]|uniref:TetR/AcrR family transcriptional regulator n=1 Tax=Ohessyouella blattaphilus TaxID=2949333 RepID=UPI003E2C911C
MNKRLRQIYEVSSNLSINKGYARTQIKDIADGIGMSVGTMYHYFVGKTDILSFILKVTIEPEFMEQDFALPIQPVLFSSLGDEIKATFAAREDAFA